MSPHTTIQICAIWLGVGFAGYFVQEQFVVAVVALFALFATGIIVREDRA